MKIPCIQALPGQPRKRKAGQGLFRRNSSASARRPAARRAAGKHTAAFHRQDDLARVDATAVDFESGAPATYPELARERGTPRAAMSASPRVRPRGKPARGRKKPPRNKLCPANRASGRPGRVFSSGISPRQRAVQRPDAPQGSTPPLFTGRTTSPASTLPPWVFFAVMPRMLRSTAGCRPVV